MCISTQVEIKTHLVVITLPLQLTCVIIKRILTFDLMDGLFYVCTPLFPLSLLDEIYKHEVKVGLLFCTTYLNIVFAVHNLQSLFAHGDLN